MCEYLIRDLPTFQLKAVLTPSTTGYFSLELLQHWPEAQHPHWRRIVQLNLDTEDLGRFAGCLFSFLEGGS